MLIVKDMLFKSYNFMTCKNNFNCSDRGQCHNGVCICQVQFAGENCTQTNLGYTATFSGIFVALALISLIQLSFCILSEYKNLKQPSICSAFRVTTQKLLHGVVIVASLTRVLYFSLQGVIPEQWLIPMESAYHPLLITGLSLVVCYWSEAFFIETASVDASRRARFLSKSAVAFLVFNVVLYIMLIAHIVATGVGCYSPGSEELWLNGAFQASFGVLLFIVYVVFLAIGVEIFFKLRGAFTLERADVASTSTNTNETVNKGEIIKSRVALVFQALLTLLTVLCVIFDAAGNLWKYNVNSRTKSTHEVIYRIAEVGAVLWFPCVLWNTSYPEKLWFLNPRCLLKLTSDAGERLLSGPPSPAVEKKYSRGVKNYNTFAQPCDQSIEIKDKEPGECWICYDPEREDAGGFISPCLCKGGMAQVHHNCLRTWLIQHPNVENACCKVCKHRYTIEQHKIRFGQVLCSSKRASLMIPAIAVAVSTPCATVMVFLLCNTLETYVKVLVLGITVISELISFKVMGINFTKLYQVTRVSALQILNYKTPSANISNSSIHHTLARNYVNINYDVIDSHPTEDDAIVNNHQAGSHDSIILLHVDS